MNSLGKPSYVSLADSIRKAWAEDWLYGGVYALYIPLFFGALTMALAGVLTWIVQAYFWLKAGQVNYWALSDLASVPHLEGWVGLNRLIAWVYGWNIGVLMLLSAFLLGTAALMLIIWVEYDRGGPRRP